ncbi:unnamed protein product [Prorocentrum cordatum]|uniref:Uncharacterized protein n=1 Tax=Prorocentrum cordatum TaxID=2364126 RepID=A0ABN9XDW1_9DINO|nr:unnamed protein product [Polarella glacialis]
MRRERRHEEARAPLRLLAARAGGGRGDWREDRIRQIRREWAWGVRLMRCRTLRNREARRPTPLKSCPHSSRRAHRAQQRVMRLQPELTISQKLPLKHVLQQRSFLSWGASEGLRSPHTSHPGISGIPVGSGSSVLLLALVGGGCVLDVDGTWVDDDGTGLVVDGTGLGVDETGLDVNGTGLGVDVDGTGLGVDETGLDVNGTGLGVDVDETWLDVDGSSSTSVSLAPEGSSTSVSLAPAAFCVTTPSVVADPGSPSTPASLKFHSGSGSAPVPLTCGPAAGAGGRLLQLARAPAAPRGAAPGPRAAEPPAVLTAPAPAPAEGDAVLEQRAPPPPPPPAEAMCTLCHQRGLPGSGDAGVDCVAPVGAGKVCPPGALQLAPHEEACGEAVHPVDHDLLVADMKTSWPSTLNATAVTAR